MKATLEIQNQTISIDLNNPYDLSFPLRGSSRNPLAWYLDPPTIQPVETADWVGSVQKGASVNFNSIWFNPHAHGTHTECVGHITPENHSVYTTLRRYFFTAELISVASETHGDDQVISKKQIQTLLGDKKPEALVIRTMPNTVSKKQVRYDHTNWPYLEEAAAHYLRELGVLHLLVDMPSVDKEKDEGALLAHKAFWNYPEAPRMEATITELIFANNRVPDGSYILELQTAPFMNDATPSRPLLYKILE